MNVASEAHTAHFGPISKEMIDYVENKVLLHSRYLFTQTVLRVQYAYCTHCNQRHRPEEPLKHCQKAVCPHCNSQCTVKKSHVGRKYLQDKAYVVFYEKSIIDPQVMTAVGFTLGGTIAAITRTLQPTIRHLAAMCSRRMVKAPCTIQAITVTLSGIRGITSPLNIRYTKMVFRVTALWTVLKRQ